jgi:hypothetical protein
MAGKKYGLDDKYKMMYGGMTNSPIKANVGLLVKAGIAGAKKIAGALSKKKDISVGQKLNSKRDVSKYDTRTLTEKGAFFKSIGKFPFVQKATELKKGIDSEFVKRAGKLKEGIDSEFVKRAGKLRMGKKMGGLQDEKLKPGAMYKANTGKLIGNQRKLDINKDGKISGEDFKLLKSKKKR